MRGQYSDLSDRTSLLCPNASWGLAPHGVDIRGQNGLATPMSDRSAIDVIAGAPRTLSVGYCASMGLAGKWMRYCSRHVSTEVMHETRSIGGSGLKSHSRNPGNRWQ